MSIYQPAKPLFLPEGGESARVIGNVANGINDCSGDKFAFVTHWLENFIVQSRTGDQICLFMGVDSGF
ncbi:MAG TPA: hypothetical protein VJ417_04415, partial [Candidatus Glassbacteria bacterium]|nr:hypothetical protein [Candidatus Glassbacteria bacterium]